MGVPVRVRGAAPKLTAGQFLLSKPKKKIMGNAINWKYISQHVIVPVQLKKPRDIVSFCRTFGMKEFSYEFSYSSETIKFGFTNGQETTKARVKKRSSYVEGEYYGERVYRQLANTLKRWEGFMSPSGMDITLSIKLFKERFDLQELDDELFKLVIYNCTNYCLKDPEYEGINPFPKESWVAKKVEALLIDQYIKTHFGLAPVGNVRKELKAKNKLVPNYSSKLFAVQA